MAFFMFIDESGQDQRESPYEVLAGVVIEDRKLWPLVHELHKAELEHFGCRYATPTREFKAKRLLKTKVYRHARGADPFEPELRRTLAHDCLADGAAALPHHFAALAQAKIAYVEDALRLAARFNCRAFASIAPKDAPRPAGSFLRKDYSYLFERFYFLLREQAGSPLGVVVFDELERSQSHLLIDQMEQYFMETAKGRARRSRIIPEPFFVHSHLTTGVHLVDLIAYVISWGVRERGMTVPAREELAPIAEAALALRYNMKVGSRHVWAFNVLTDLRPRVERGEPIRGGV
jgi:hypothetical protein